MSKSHYPGNHIRNAKKVVHYTAAEYEAELEAECKANQDAFQAQEDAKKARRKQWDEDDAKADRISKTKPVKGAILKGLNFLGGLSMAFKGEFKQ